MERRLYAEIGTISRLKKEIFCRSLVKQKVGKFLVKVERKLLSRERKSLERQKTN